MYIKLMAAHEFSQVLDPVQLGYDRTPEKSSYISRLTIEEINAFVQVAGIKKVFG